jgi:hypothetical protein
VALRRVEPDLRAAALQEYPEFGLAPWPLPWWQLHFQLLGVLFLVLIEAVVLALAVS